MNKDKFKQLLIWIDKGLHAEVKGRAALRNISMALYVERVLTREVAKEKRYDDKE